MQLEDALKRYTDEHQKFVKKVEVSERYYRNDTDIMRDVENQGGIERPKVSRSEDPLRTADNRISHNFHFILTTQEASYAFTEPPKFDAGDKELNDLIDESLGSEDEFAKEAKDLCVDAVNAGVAWLHIWIDEEEGTFEYANVNPKNVIPIYTKDLKRKLSGLIYTYEDVLDDGQEVTVYEYWTKEKMQKFYKANDAVGESIGELMPARDFVIRDVATGHELEQTNEFINPFSDIPFIEFKNNNISTPNLDNYKKHIDIYDKVYSGFVNDIEDIQQIILVLRNYGGADMDEFRNDLAIYKTIKVEDHGDGDKSGVDTLSIEIPVEARDTLLDRTKEQIYESGQGVNPHKEVGTAASGVALKQIYSMLELKVGLLETEFRLGFTKLVKFILEFHGKDIKKHKITQKWTRTRIDNDLEQAQIVSTLSTDTSRENIAKANPLVSDWEAELKLQEQDRTSEERMMDDYRDEDEENDLEDRLGGDDDGKDE